MQLLMSSEKGTPESLSTHSVLNLYHVEAKGKYTSNARKLLYRSFRANPKVCWVLHSLSAWTLQSEKKELHRPVMSVCNVWIAARELK